MSLYRFPLNPAASTFVPGRRALTPCGPCEFLGHTRENCPDHPHATDVQGASCPHPRLKDLRRQAGSQSLPGNLGSQIGPLDSISHVGSVLDRYRATRGSMAGFSSDPRIQLVEQLRAEPEFARAAQSDLEIAATEILAAEEQAAREKLRALVPTATFAGAPLAHPNPSAAPHPQAPGPAHQIINAPGVAPPPQRPTVLTDGIEIGRLQVWESDEWHAYAPVEITAANVQAQLTASGAGTLHRLHHVDVKLTTPSAMALGQDYEIRMCLTRQGGGAVADVDAFNLLPGMKFSRLSADARTPLTIMLGDHDLTTTPLYLHVVAQYNGTGKAWGAATHSGHVTTSVGAKVHT